MAEYFTVYADEGFPDGVPAKVYAKKGNALRRAKTLFEAHSVKSGQILITRSLAEPIYVYRTDGGELVVEAA